MSIYRMLRKGLEFDALRDFEIAADAKHYSNPTGLIEVMDRAVSKYDHMVADEDFEFAVADERLALVEFLSEKALRHIKDDDRAVKRIADRANAHRRSCMTATERFEPVRTPRYT